MSNCLMMGRSRQLHYAANTERRRRESKEMERRPRTRPLVGRGWAQTSKILKLGEAPVGKFHVTLARGRSRPTYTPRPFLQIHHSYLPHHLPHCTAAGFGYADPNILYPPRVNNPRPHLPCPQPYVLPPSTRSGNKC